MLPVASLSIFAIMAIPILGQDAEILRVLDAVPETSFTCDDKTFGFYADVEADCQQYLVCDYPVNVVCADAPQAYIINARIGDPNAKLID
ncbi:unnamed protein product [Notodromas monacha]|uniref:Chitin-binding type-2 domain-containing protein n=1 Tax=Notodromas monacha TaxID=399045 RepID=A0A7R9BPE6_9CRUS|nr:unnamed protein product [Notodromas monacha]CAG0918978.1 unnamed protein product [Notodromas monacha]